MPLYAYTTFIVYYKMYKFNKGVDFKYKTSLPGLMVILLLLLLVLRYLRCLPTIKKRLYPLPLLHSHTDLVEFVLLLFCYFSSAFEIVCSFSFSSFDFISIMNLRSGTIQLSVQASKKKHANLPCYMP